MSDARFFYEGAGRRAAVDALFEGLRGVEGLVVLSGPAGSGRSTVLQRFRDEADPGVLAIASIAGDILMSPEKCFDLLCRDLGADGTAATLDSLLDGAIAQGRHPAIVVDDAHELGEETLAAIIGFCRRREDPVPLVLAGDETLEAVLDGDMPRVLVRLGALGEEDCEDYIAAWLAVEDEDELPSNRTVARLCRQSRGLPGNLEDLLRAGEAGGGTLLSSGFPLWHLVLGAGGVVLLVLLFVAVQRKAGPAPLPPAEVAVALPSPNTVTNASAAEMAPQSRLAEAAVPHAPPEVTGGQAGEQAVALPPPVETMARPASAPAAPLPALPVAAAPTQPGRASDKRGLPAAATHGPAGKPAGRPARSPTSTSRYSADEDLLMKQKASRYTLQLFASFNESAVENFREKHPSVPMHLFRTVREDLPWHVAVVGDYRSKDEAKEATARLPADIAKLNPWARTFQGIQDELRRRKD